MPGTAVAGSAGVGIGIVGCGNAAEVLHLPYLSELGARVVALADHRAEALSKLGDRYGVERRYPDVAQLLEDPAVDAIAVLTPPEVREEIVIPALEAGKHVLVEKPVALTVAECDRMIQASARRPELRVMAGFPLRFHRLIRDARDFVASGRLGAPSAIVTSNFGPETELAAGREMAPWRFERGRGGGVIFGKGVHQWDLWRYMLGLEAEEISAFLHADGDHDKGCVTSAKLTGGAVASTTMVTSREESTRMSVHGAEGRIDIDPHRFDGLVFKPADRYSGSPKTRLIQGVNALRTLPEGIRSLRGGGEYRLSYLKEWRHFLACVSGEATVASTLEDGREATRLARAAMESAESGRSVKLSAA